MVQFVKEKFGNNLALSLKELSLKLTVLLALSNATRASDLVVLDIGFTQRTATGMIFRITGLTKTRRSGPSRSLSIAKFEEPGLCPVETLKCYIERTQELRRTDRESNPLVCKPHGAVSSATIARWIKEVLSLAGMDTKKFSAHSTRSALLHC